MSIGARTLWSSSAAFLCLGWGLASCSQDGASEGSQTQAGTTATAGSTPAAGGGGLSAAVAGAGAQSIGTAGANARAGTGASPSTGGASAPIGPDGRTDGAAGAAGSTAGAGGSAGSAAVSGSGGSAAAGAGGAAGAEPPGEACDPADQTAKPMMVEFARPGEGAGLTDPSGEFEPIMEADPGIPTHTVIRPEPLGKIKHPILAWGQGGCGKSGNIGMFSNLYREFASHGVLIVADGPPTRGGPTMAGSDAGPLLHALEWAIKENDRPCSQYYRKLDVTKLAVSGQSCGGLMAIQAATDPRITTAFPYNSGLFARDQSIYDKLHAPMAIFDGGPEDIAYANGLADFNAIDKIPILFANPTSCSSNAHVCTFFDAGAGEFGRAGVAWLRWHLMGDQGPTGKGMFIGDNCGICGTAWDIMWKNAPM